jgi:hypothetical protein
MANLDIGSNLGACSLDCSTRNTTALASRALSPDLETQVKGRFPYVEARYGNHCIDQGDGAEQSAFLSGLSTFWRSDATLHQERRVNHGSRTMISSGQRFQESTFTTSFTWATYSPAAQGQLLRGWELQFHS